MTENEENVAARESNWCRTVGLVGVTQVCEGKEHLFGTVLAHSIARLLIFIHPPAW